MTKSCAVLVPLYRPTLSNSESYALNNNLRILENWPIFLVAPKSIKSFMEKGVFSQFKFNHVEYFSDYFFTSLYRYSQLLLSAQFYKRFSDFDCILIVQTDAIVFFDSLQSWIDKGFSYVGAPWLNARHFPTEPITFLGVGNGGLSLRRVSDFLRVLASFAYIPNTYHRRTDSFLDVFRFMKHRMVFSYSKWPLQPKINEDAFWGLLVPRRFEFFKVADPLTAAAFSFEVEPRSLFKLLGGTVPFGCHAWEKYDKEFWVELGLVPPDEQRKNLESRTPLETGANRV